MLSFTGRRRKGTRFAELSLYTLDEERSPAAAARAVLAANRASQHNGGNHRTPPSRRANADTKIQSSTDQSVIRRKYCINETNAESLDNVKDNVFDEHLEDSIPQEEEHKTADKDVEFSFSEVDVHTCSNNSETSTQSCKINRESKSYNHLCEIHSNKNQNKIPQSSLSLTENLMNAVAAAVNEEKTLSNANPNGCQKSGKSCLFTKQLKQRNPLSRKRNVNVMLKEQLFSKSSSYLQNFVSTEEFPEEGEILHKSERNISSNNTLPSLKYEKNKFCSLTALTQPYHCTKCVKHEKPNKETPKSFAKNVGIIKIKSLNSILNVKKHIRTFSDFQLSEMTDYPHLLRRRKPAGSLEDLHNSNSLCLSTHSSSQDDICDIEKARELVNFENARENDKEHRKARESDKAILDTSLSSVNSGQCLVENDENFPPKDKLRATCDNKLSRLSVKVQINTSCQEGIKSFNDLETSSSTLSQCNCFPQSTNIYKNNMDTTCTLADMEADISDSSVATATQPNSPSELSLKSTQFCCDKEHNITSGETEVEKCTSDSEKSNSDSEKCNTESLESPSEYTEPNVECESFPLILCKGRTPTIV